MTARQIRLAFAALERVLRKCMKERDAARAEVVRLRKRLGKHGRN